LDTSICYYFQILSTYLKFHESKNYSIRWHINVRTQISKLYTFLENILQIVQILNENNGYDQQNISRKCIQMSAKENIWKICLLNQVRYYY